MKYSIDMNNRQVLIDIQGLESIREADQKAIKDFKAGQISASILASINAKHAETVRAFISAHGFPTKSNASEKAYKAAVLVALHSGDEAMLTQSIDAVRLAHDGSVERKDIAFMTDRLCVLQGKRQRYGTQYKIGSDGAIDFIDIEDLAGLDARRKELGMEPFAEYESYVRSMIKR